MPYRYLLSLLVLLFISRATFATHIRAGEIIATRISKNVYEFTFIGYRDSDPRNVEFGNGIFDFGDGQTMGGQNGERIPWIEPVDLGNFVERWQFTVRHTYSGGSNYVVSYTEENRNEDVQNMSNSVGTKFHVETLILVDDLVINSTPFFTVPPIDQGIVGAIFEHNPGAFDPDGDSLSYHFTVPKQSSRLDVAGYLALNDPSFYVDPEKGNAIGTGPAELTIDSSNGTLVWDAPGGATIPELESREFNVAFIVKEWRRINGEMIQLGYVTRDMQIIIWNYENNPPELDIPDDTCVVAGQTIISRIIGTDQDGDPVKLEAFGGPFELSPPASFIPNPPEFLGPPSELVFEWTTDCGVIRAEPYEVQFKATDDPEIPGVPNAPGQVNFETWKISVVGPAPEGLIANTISGNRIQLIWNEYSCSNAENLQIWRRVGEFDFDRSCTPGIPENSGYELIETIEASATEFVDSNVGIGLNPGSKYCYRLVATFPEPLGGLSIASYEACDSIKIDVPIITNVDVVSTDLNQGSVRVSWTPPYEIDAGQFPPNYTYELVRTEGQGPGGTFTSVTTTSDTTFLDTGLNTQENSYSYRIILFDGNNLRVDSSQQASTVRLKPVTDVGAIQLYWDANVPWSNSSQTFPYHYIYRDNVLNDDLTRIQLIDSVEVTMEGLTYIDDGRFNGIDLDEEVEYCYYVTAQGSYDNSLLPEPLINNSQIICVQPKDSIPPCPPLSVTFNSVISCESQFSCSRLDNDLNNSFMWEIDDDFECGSDLAFFRVYRSETGEEGTFSKIGETSSKEFFDDGLSSLAFCYFITGVDRSGNESLMSEIICNQNCPQYLLPNVFTPNGDGKNDTFRPLQNDGDCPRFVESVVFKVYNRNGVELFSYNSIEATKDVAGGQDIPADPILINWDGKSNAGAELPAGAYYYLAEVRFTDLNTNDEAQVIKGWVQLFR